MSAALFIAAVRKNARKSICIVESFCFGFQEHLVAQYKAQSGRLPLENGGSNRSLDMDGSAAEKHSIDGYLDPSAAEVTDRPVPGHRTPLSLDERGQKLADSYGASSSIDGAVYMATDRNDLSAQQSARKRADRAEDDHGGGHEEEILDMSETESSSCSSVGIDVAMTTVSNVAVGAHLRSALPSSSSCLNDADTADTDPSQKHPKLQRLRGKPAKHRRTRQHGCTSQHIRTLSPKSAAASGATIAVESPKTQEQPKHAEAHAVRSLSATLMSSPTLPTCTFAV